MDISSLNIYILSTYNCASPILRERLDELGASFGLYHSYSDLYEIVSQNSEACLVIDLLGHEKLLFNWDFEFFVSQAAAGGMAQALRWNINSGKPLVEIDSNFRIISEEAWPIKEVKDGLERLPIYYFASGQAINYVKKDSILFKGEEWIGYPVGFPRQALSYKDKKPALFLDRDGIINEDQGYVYLYENLKYKEKIFPIIKMFNERNWPVFVLTNQSGVGQGKYREEDVIKLHNQMKDDFKKLDLVITEWNYSPYHWEKGLGDYKRMSFTRKPGSGMALQLLENHAVDIEKSFMIGDKLSDQILLPGITTLLLEGNYPLEGSKSPTFKNLSDVESFIKERI